MASRAYSAGTAAASARRHKLLLQITFIHINTELERLSRLSDILKKGREFLLFSSQDTDKYFTMDLQFAYLIHTSVPVTIKVAEQTGTG